jgi:hypothetical protein
MMPVHILMTDSYAFPFALKAEAVNGWLATLESLSANDRINQLYTIITKLSNSAIEASVIYAVLDQLTPAILTVSNSLEHVATSSKTAYSADKTRKLAYFSIQLTQMLCFAYHNIHNDNALTQAQQASIIYKAMQLACLLSRRRTVFHEAPEPALWARIGELYLNARALDSLDVAIQDVVPGLTSQPSIEAVLKQTLLFSICNAYHYSPPEISDIFSATGKLCHLLKLDPNPSDSSFFCWRPDALAAPQYADPFGVKEDTLYINTSGLIAYFEKNKTQRKNYKTFLSTLPRLTAFEKIRESVDPSSPAECDIAIGTARATQFLKTLINRYLILELSGAHEEQSEQIKLELEPMEDKKNIFGLLATKLLKDERPEYVIKIRSFETHSPNFFATKIRQNCTIGEPLVFIRKNKRPLLAVIRYLRIEPGIGLNHILLEILDGDVYPIEINETGGFIIRRSAGGKEIILPPGNYAIRTVFSIDKGLITGTFRMDKFVESTPHFMRFEVSRVQAD